MFIGREKELVLLQQDYIGKAVMVYGKRRVGKTTLIQKALDNCPYQTVYFECLKGTVQENIDSLVDELVRAKILPVALSFSTLQDVFTYLNTLPQKMVVVIDEYPYLKVMNEPTTVDSVFQSIIDNRLGNIELILSGSHIGMMKDLLQEKNALYGRFAVTIKLNELNYLDTAKFYPDKQCYCKGGECFEYYIQLSSQNRQLQCQPYRYGSYISGSALLPDWCCQRELGCRKKHNYRSLGTAALYRKAGSWQ